MRARPPPPIKFKNSNDEAAGTVAVVMVMLATRDQWPSPIFPIGEKHKIIFSFTFLVVGPTAMFSCRPKEYIFFRRRKQIPILYISVTFFFSFVFFLPSSPLRGGGFFFFARSFAVEKETDNITSVRLFFFYKIKAGSKKIYFRRRVL